MPRRRLERKHRVKADLNVPELVKAGSSLSLSVYEYDQKIGEITLGRGSLYWRGAKRWRQTRKRISWDRFADAMNRLAYGD